MKSIKTIGLLDGLSLCNDDVKGTVGINGTKIAIQTDYEACHHQLSHQFFC